MKPPAPATARLRDDRGCRKAFLNMLQAVGLWCLLWEPSTSAQTSSGKLSAHLINAYTAGASNIVAGHPRILKILDLGPDMLRAARAYKAGTPEGKIVLRIYTPKSYAVTEDPAASATNFWTTVLRPPLNALTASDRALIDYLEGPNEGDSTPTWQSPEAAQWFSTFWQKLSPLIAAAGFKPCIGSIAVGNPPGTPAQIQSHISTFVPALRLAQSLGGAWSYHAYTLNYTTDAGTEFYYSLRYRQFYSQFTSQYPDLATMPLILTEGGVDQSGSPSGSGWQARGTAADYERWLNWFDRQIGADSYVLGCTLFQIGNPAGWSSFDLEPLGTWFRGYLLGPSGVPGAPGGLTGTVNNGAVLLRWTSPPLAATTWKVKRSQTSGGPYSTIAGNVTEGVTATTYTDGSVAGGGTYYYVVSAVNAVGEGPNAAEVRVTLPSASLPDVVVTDVNWTPNPAFAGANITFRATVRNQGVVPTPAGTILGVGFSVDGGPNITWSGSHAAALNPGASVNLAANGGLSGSTWRAIAGPHTLVATVDDVNRFPEINEGNNALSVSMPIATSAPKFAAVTLESGPAVRLLFSATPGLNYRVEYRSTFQAPWQALGPDRTASSSVVSLLDWVTNSPQRIYRVQQLR